MAVAPPKRSTVTSRAFRRKASPPSLGSHRQANAGGYELDRGLADPPGHPPRLSSAARVGAVVSVERLVAREPAAAARCRPRPGPSSCPRGLRLTMAAGHGRGARLVRRLAGVADHRLVETIPVWDERKETARVPEVFRAHLPVLAGHR